MYIKTRKVAINSIFVLCVANKNDKNVLYFFLRIHNFAIQFLREILINDSFEIEECYHLYE